MKDVTIQLPGLSIHRGSMDATAIAGITGVAGRPMQAIVGYELFQSCVVSLDYAAGVMDVWIPADAPHDWPGVALPMELEENLPYVDGEPVPSLDMASFRRRLEEEGRTVRMTVSRGDETRTLTLVLRRIL